MKKLMIVIFVCAGIFFAADIYAQGTPKPAKTGQNGLKNTQNGNKNSPKPEKTDENAASLPSGYRGITVGMGFEEVKKALKEDTLFGYKGERDISLLPSQNRSLIETAGYSAIKRAWFQFYDGKLYIITIQMDTDKIDYYSIYSALTAKYGEPYSIDPKKAVWEGGSITMTLERPLSIKYIDLAVFNALLEKSGTDKIFTETLREEFINDF